MKRQARKQKQRRETKAETAAVGHEQGSECGRVKEKKGEERKARSVQKEKPYSPGPDPEGHSGP